MLSTMISKVAVDGAGLTACISSVGVRSFQTSPFRVGVCTYPELLVFSTILHNLHNSMVLNTLCLAIYELQMIF